MKKIIWLLVFCLLATMLGCTRENQQPVTQPASNFSSSPNVTVFLPVAGNQTLQVPSTISVPAGKPVIYERLAHIMSGNFSYLYTYQDGTVIFVIEKNLRLPMPQNPPTLIWKIGHISTSELNALLGLFQSEQFASLNNSYTFPGTPIAGGGFSMPDEGLIVIVDWATVNKTVSTFGFPTTDLPLPLGDIYVRLQNISLNTTEVAQEQISE